MTRRFSHPLDCFTAASMIGLLLVASMAGATIPTFDASYELRKGPLVLGKAEVSLERPSPRRYRYRMHTKPIGVASLFISGEVVEVSEGRVNQTGFHPEIYRYRRTGDAKARSAELRFDWQRGQVVNDIGDHPWRMEITDDTIDRLVSPLQLMYDLEQGRTDPVYRIADGGKLKIYAMHIEGREKIQTPLGRFETVEVVRQSQDGENVTRLWCAPELHFLAVRIERWDRHHGNFVLMLDSLSGITPRARVHSGASAEGRAHMLR